EARAVLAHAPSLVLELAFARGGFERAVREALGLVLLGVEFREMLADDLIGRVILDPLCPEIPVGHAPVRVEHEDGVIGYPLDENAEAALAFEQRLSGSGNFGDV